ncbi:hypothetical protein RclHR1_00380033 [Rhizophagus clarus]|uniref:Arrestin domain-containing protein 2-like n=1 Tax=Rhizophagus clarus TaxID=94130 RepID=A0A2Z6RQ05_9GLOM|nr:hypothetical protein RclHR1_00380033 [Rhizophagus clarus]GET01495.1 arrestin domain-containing protein 2-like [Rhizophagus clarus]
MSSQKSFLRDNSLQLPATAYFTKINYDTTTQFNKFITSQNIIQEEPTINDYIKYNKNLTFSYHPYSYKFQQGPLGEHDSYLIGLLNLNFLSFSSSIKINNIYLKFKGREKVKWIVKDGPRSRRVYGEEQILCDVKYKIWESTRSNNIGTRLTDLLSSNGINGINENDSIIKVPFKVKLPYNLPNNFETDIGNVEYTLKAIINTSNGNGISATILQQQHVSEIKISLKHTLILNNDNNPPYIIHGENTANRNNNSNMPTLLNYTMVLPPNKNINIGVYISIPIRIRILEPGVSLEKIEIMLRTSKDFRTKNSESRHIKEISSKMIIPRKDINFIKSKEKKKKFKHERVDGECIQNINFYIPNDTIPTYNGRYITITHQLLLNFSLLYTNQKGQISRLNDYIVEEHITVSNIQKNFNIQLPNFPSPPKFFNPKQFTSSQFTSSIDSLQSSIPKCNFTYNSSKSSDSSGSSEDSLSMDSLYYYSRPASSLFSLHSINSSPNGGILRVFSST